MDLNLNFNLVDCLDEIIPDEDIKFLSEEDEVDLYEMCFSLIHEFMEENPTIISDPHFEELLEENINELVHKMFDGSLYYTEESEEEIDEIITICKRDFFEFIIPPRSYKSSIIINKPNIEKIACQINILRQKPQPTQRTAEWYADRFNLITASNAYKIFESDAMRNQLIYEKCNRTILFRK